MLVPHSLTEAASFPVLTPVQCWYWGSGEEEEGKEVAQGHVHRGAPVVSSVQTAQHYLCAHSQKNISPWSQPFSLVRVKLGFVSNISKHLSKALQIPPKDPVDLSSHCPGPEFL